MTFSRLNFLNQKLTRATPVCSPDFLPRALASSSDMRPKSVFMRSLGIVTRPNFSAYESYSTCLLRAWFAMTLTLTLSFRASSSSSSLTSVSIRKVRVSILLKYCPTNHTLGENRYRNRNQSLRSFVVRCGTFYLFVYTPEKYSGLTLILIAKGDSEDGTDHSHRFKKI